MTDEKRAGVIAALINERKSALHNGRFDLVEQIDDQLRRHGYEAATPHKRALKRKLAGVG